MGALLHRVLDAQRRAECQAADEADRRADQALRQALEDAAVRQAREAQRHCPPFWMFGERTAVQERIAHPLARAAEASSRPTLPDPSRFGVHP